MRFVIYINDVATCTCTCEVLRNMDPIISALSGSGHKIRIVEYNPNQPFTL